MVGSTLQKKQMINKKKEIINNLTNIILKYIFEDFLKNYLS